MDLSANLSDERIIGQVEDLHHLLALRAKIDHFHGVFHMSQHMAIFYSADGT